MDQVMAVTTARENLAEVIDDVRTLGRRVALSRHGKPVAVIVPVEDAEAIEVAEDALDKAAAIAALGAYLEAPQTRDAMAVFGGNADTPGVSYTVGVEAQVANLPGMTVGALLEIAIDLSRNGPPYTVREVSERIFSIRADGCRLVFTDVDDAPLVLAVAG